MHMSHVCMCMSSQMECEQLMACTGRFARPAWMCEVQKIVVCEWLAVRAHCVVPSSELCVVFM